MLQSSLNQSWHSLIDDNRSLRTNETWAQQSSGAYTIHCQVYHVCRSSGWQLSEVQNLSMVTVCIQSSGSLICSITSSSLISPVHVSPSATLVGILTLFGQWPLCWHLKHLRPQVLISTPAPTVCSSFGFSLFNLSWWLLLDGAVLGR